MSTLFLVPDAAPNNATITALNWTSIKVKWQNVPKYFQNGIILGYRIQVFNTSEMSLLQEIVVGPYQFSTFINGLEPITNFSVSIKAFTSVGDGVPFNDFKMTHEERKYIYDIKES